MAFHLGTTRLRALGFQSFAAPFVTAVALLGFPGAARASFLSGETLDKAADVLALIILFVVPIIGIVVFWLVHILPEKIAHARQHPQTEAIQVLCLLSLFFGGMLWPIAWLWAYSKPVLYKLAYGTDKAEPHEPEAGKKGPAEAARAHAPKAALRAAPSEVSRLKEGLDALEKKGVPADELRSLRAQVAALEASLASGSSKEGAT